MGLPKKSSKQVENLETSILFQKIENEAVTKALGGEEGSTIVQDSFHGNDVFVSYSYLDIKGLEWVIITEMDAYEIYEPLHLLQRNLLIATIIMMLLITVIANLAASQFFNPIESINRKFKQD